MCKQTITQVATKPALKQITPAELSKHNTPDDLHVAVRGKVYDITEFANKHPGGNDVLYISGGRDATEVFEMYHKHAVHMILAKLPIVGEFVNPDLPVFPEPNLFYRTVKQRVEKYFADTKQDPKMAYFMALRYFLIFATVIGSFSLQTFYFTNFFVRVGLSIVMGMACALVGLMPMHDASHFTFTKNPLVWKLLGASHDFLNGASYLVWIYQHAMGHHAYTNIAGADPDVETNDPDLRRINKTQAWLPMYIYQHFYMPLLYGFLGLKTRMQDFNILFVLKTNGAIKVNPPTMYHKVMFFAGKITWFSWRLVLPLFYLPLWQHIILLMLQDAVTSFWLACTFQANHVVTDVLWPEADQDNFVNMDWAEMQVQTTQDYAHNSWFWNVFSGALNHQATHHLFPGISQYYYPEISPIVEQTAKEFNVRYFYKDTFWEAFGTHIGFLHLMGRDPAKTK